MTLTSDLVSRVIMSGAILIASTLFEVGIPNLVCGWILGWRSVMFRFWVKKNHLPDLNISEYACK